MQHERFMKEALILAREAFCAGEVPVGCVIVRGDEIVGRGRNGGRKRRTPWRTRSLKQSRTPAFVFTGGGFPKPGSM